MSTTYRLKIDTNDGVFFFEGGWERQPEFTVDETNAKRRAVDIADTEGAWNFEKNRYYPPRSINWVQLVEPVKTSSPCRISPTGEHALEQNPGPERGQRCAYCGQHESKL
jgi:hypothetical protein